LPKEIEKKIIVSEDVFNRYLSDLMGAKEVKQVDTYFDSESFDLGMKGESLRIRDVVTEGISKITYKYPVGSESSLFIREETEICLPPQTKEDKAVLMGVFKKLGIETDIETPDRRKAEEALKRAYNMVGTVEKNGYRFWRGDTKIALDVTTFRTAISEKTVYIIEIEGAKDQIEMEYRKLVDTYGNIGSIEVSEKNNYQMLLSM